MRWGGWESTYHKQQQVHELAKPEQELVNEAEWLHANMLVATPVWVERQWQGRQGRGIKDTKRQLKNSLEVLDNVASGVRNAQQAVHDGTVDVLEAHVEATWQLRVGAVVVETQGRGNRLG